MEDTTLVSSNEADDRKVPGSLSSIPSEIRQTIFNAVRVEFLLTSYHIPPPIAHPLLHLNHSLRSEYLEIQRIAIQKHSRTVRLDFYPYPTGPRFVPDDGQSGYTQQAYADDSIPWLQSLKRGVEHKELEILMSEAISSSWLGIVKVKLNGEWSDYRLSRVLN